MSSLIVENSNTNKEHNGGISGQAQHLENAALLPDQSKSSGQEITIKVFPSSQGISLVTGNILSTDVGTFSTQVPAILTEGDAEDSETHYQVKLTKVHKHEHCTSLYKASDHAAVFNSVQGLL